MQAFICEELDGRKSCRTVRDALDRLGILDAPEAIVATIHAMELPLPNGQTPGRVSIGTGAPGDSNRRFIRLPDCNIFRASLMDGTPIHGAIHELDGARVEPNGNVHLADGRHLRRVEVQPGIAYRHYDFTQYEHSIVHQALKLINEEDRCYRAVNEDLLPGLKWLDYAAIQEVHLEDDKRLVADIEKALGLSRSKLKIRNVLKLAGMRFPQAARETSPPPSV